MPYAKTKKGHAYDFLNSPFSHYYSYATFYSRLYGINIIISTPTMPTTSNCSKCAHIFDIPFAWLDDIFAAHFNALFAYE